MDYNALQSKKDFYQKYKNTLSDFAVQNYEQAFEIEFTHNSTAIEGNTLSLIETKVILEDKISIGGKKLREIYEIVNHNKAYQYVKGCIAEGKPLDENRIKDIHAILMENIIIVKNFYADIPCKTELNGIELAAWTHAEFVKIHPFIDGNGRTSRLIMNYQLMTNGFLPISISKESRLDYFNALESYAVDGDLNPFADLMAALEDQKLDFYIGAIEQQRNNN